jgi:hypothetical protein
MRRHRNHHYPDKLLLTEAVSVLHWRVVGGSKLGSKKDSVFPYNALLVCK